MWEETCVGREQAKSEEAPYDLLVESFRRWQVRYMHHFIRENVPAKGQRMRILGAGQWM